MKFFFILTLSFLLPAVLLPAASTLEPPPPVITDWFGYGSPASPKIFLCYSGFDVNFAMSNHESNMDTASFGKTKNRKLAFWETALFSGISAAHYWITYTKWMEDWQYELTWSDQRIRFLTTEALRFDSNCMGTNFVHALQGALVYNFARTNNLSLGESFLYSLLNSLFWEYVVEWRETVSINDHIITPLGGFPVGESLYQASSYFKNRSGAANQILSFLLNPVLTINHWLNTKYFGVSMPYNPPPQHTAQFSLGLVRGGDSQPEGDFTHLTLGLETEFITIPHFGEPGRRREFIKDTLQSRIFSQITLSDSGVEELWIQTEAVFWGWLDQTVKKDGFGIPHGHAFYFGLGSSFDFFKKRPTWEYDVCNTGADSDARNSVPQPTLFSDKIAVANIVGPILDISAFLGHFHLRAGVGAYLNFGMVTSHAINEYSRHHDISNAKTTILAYGYYYAFGLTLSSHLSLACHGLELRARTRYYGFSSVEGLDRFQDQVTDDFHITDQALFLTFGLGYRFERSPVKLEAIYELIARRGTIEEITQRRTENRIYLQLKLVL